MSWYGFNGDGTPRSRSEFIEDEGPFDAELNAVECEHCGGSGGGPDPELMCRACLGTGYVEPWEL